MPDRPDTPQLPLDFEAESPPPNEAGVNSASNVIRLTFGLVRSAAARPKAPDEVDSVLEEVLSTAKRLNW